MEITITHIRRLRSPYKKYCGNTLGGSISFEHFISEQEDVRGHVDTLPLCDNCITAFFNEVEPEIARRLQRVKTQSDSSDGIEERSV